MNAIKRRAVLAAALALCASPWLASSACKSTPTIPEAGAMPAGVTLSGVWYSDQFEQMYMRQVGDEVRGVYTYKYGGTVEGQITGDLIKFRWIDPGDPDVARRGFQGEGYWKIVTEGDRVYLRGQWGYNEEATGGGPWEAERIRDIESSDPKSIEEYRKRSVR